MNTDPNPRIAQAIQQDLAAIGVKAEIKAMASPMSSPPAAPRARRR